MGVISIEHYQPQIDAHHDDSFWYDGDVASIKKDNREVVVFAVGDIIIYIEEDNRSIYGPEDLHEEEYNLGDPYLWDLEDSWKNNNWFEFGFKLNGEWIDAQNLFDADVAFSYSEAMQIATEIVQDDSWWEEEERLLNDESNSGFQF